MRFGIVKKSYIISFYYEELGWLVLDFLEIKILSLEILIKNSGENIQFSYE